MAEAGSEVDHEVGAVAVAFLCVTAIFQNVLVSCVILFDRVLLSKRLQKAIQMQQPG